MGNEKPKNIYQRILAVMEDVKRVEKKGRNTEQKYDYASEADITDLIRPLLVKHGLVLLMTKKGDTRWRSRGETKSQVAGITMDFTLVNADDPTERISYEMSGEGMDGGDKNEYKAFTGCVKYALTKPFLISTGDDPEKDGEKKEKLRELERKWKDKANADPKDQPAFLKKGDFAVEKDDDEEDEL